MTLIGFWNVERLGRSTDAVRKNNIHNAFTGTRFSYTLFCELTTQCTYPPAQNLTYRRQGASDLCYGCLDSTDTNSVLTQITPTTNPCYKPGSATAAGTPFTVTTFRNIANRAVGYVGFVGGTHVYVIHAPAFNSRAAKVMTYIACYLQNLHTSSPGGSTTPWLIIGDFNVEPDDLKAVRSPAWGFTHIHYDTRHATHRSRNRVESKYDYVLSNFRNVTVTVQNRSDSQYELSDHQPIYVEF